MDKRVSGRKGLSNALRHEIKFFLDFEQLIRIDNLDGSFDKNFLFIQPDPPVLTARRVNVERIRAEPFFQGL